MTTTPGDTTLHVMTPELARQLKAEFAALLARHVCLESDPQTVYTKAEGAVPQPRAEAAPEGQDAQPAAVQTRRATRRARPQQLQAQAVADPF